MVPNPHINLVNNKYVFCGVVRSAAAWELAGSPALLLTKPGDIEQIT